MILKLCLSRGRSWPRWNYSDCVAINMSKRLRPVGLTQLIPTCECGRLSTSIAVSEHGRMIHRRRSLTGWQSLSPVIRNETPTPQLCEQLLQCVVSILHVLRSVAAGDSLSATERTQTHYNEFNMSFRGVHDFHAYLSLL